MYSLEKHLENKSLEESQFELLNSIWKLNKKVIPEAQRAITFNFPHYSLHEKSHSETILKRIEAFLGDERIKQLSPTDTWMILMAAFTHDLGMVVFHSALEKKWVEEDFQLYLSRLANSTTDKDLQKAARLLLETGEGADKSPLFPLEIRRSVILVTADFYRRIHHERSKDIISGVNQEFLELLNKFHLTSIPNRFSHILAEIAYAHGIDFYVVLQRLEYQADGFGNDKIHPRFIACLLRLGDLLDVDDKRFDIFSEKVFTDQLPETSQLHFEKHSATKHLLVSPSSIEITVDCKTDEVYRVAREWFDWLQKEVENQSREWSTIAPVSLGGLPPTISRGKLKVLYRSVEPRRELMNLRFTIANSKAFEILEGGAIYETPGFVFIRELIQNAIDATKIQIWRTLSSGVYDYSIKQHLESGNLTHSDLMNQIVFPSDIPNDIFQGYEIVLKCSWSKTTSNILVVEVIDHGTGITDNDLIRMTHHVGESRNADTEMINMKVNSPYWLRPTGAFGVGLQSLFLVAQTFTVQTKAAHQEAREILFVSSGRGGYSKITDRKLLMEEGTKVSIDISRSDFGKLFGENVSYDVLEKFDFFSDKLGDIHLYNLKEHLLAEFANIPLLKIEFFDQVLRSPFEFAGKTNNNLVRSTVKTKRTGSIQVVMEDHSYDMILKIYNVSENIIGSDLKLVFFKDYSDVVDARGKQHLYAADRYLVRDIPVNQKFPSFYLTHYLNITWNFQSPESDKILGISRDRLIAKKRREFDNILIREILPATMKLLYLLFEENYGNELNHEQSIAIQYFHIEMTCLMCDVPSSHSKNIYNNFQIAPSLVTTTRLDAVRLADFFGSTVLYFVNKEYSIPEDARQESMSTVWSSVASDLESGLVIWDKGYFAGYLRLGGYTLASYNVETQPNGKVHIKKLVRNSSNYPLVLVNEEGRKELYATLLRDSFHKKRATMIPLEKYGAILAVKESFDLIVDRVEYCRHYIISPFSGLVQRNKLASDLKNEIDTGHREALLKAVKSAYLNSLIPDTLVSFIIENSSSNVGVSKESILDTYNELIVDLLLIDDPV